MDYRTYKMNTKEHLLAFISLVLVLLILSYLFFGVCTWLLAALPFYFFYEKLICNALKRRRDRLIQKQFVDFINALSEYLKIGYSIENGIRECRRELTLLYGENCIMCQEITQMDKKMQLNLGPNEAMSDFAHRTDIDEIIFFSNVFGISLRTGNKLAMMIKLVANSITENFAVKEEIAVAIHEKEIEQIIMCLVPPILILYLKATSPDLVEILYGSMLGNIVMFGCLAVYLLAVVMAFKILESS